jgi:hypothetical protein
MQLYRYDLIEKKKQFNEKKYPEQHQLDTKRRSKPYYTKLSKFKFEETQKDR